MIKKFSTQEQSLVASFRCAQTCEEVREWVSEVEQLPHLRAALVMREVLWHTIAPSRTTFGNRH